MPLAPTMLFLVLTKLGGWGGRWLIEKFRPFLSSFDPGGIMFSGFSTLSPPLASHSDRVSAFCNAYFIYAG
uniref:Putative secreted protein n=1 Tax=Ixodes ricinus TaxID=34613 RepID=A0A147BTS3_IXORI